MPHVPAELASPTHVPLRPPPAGPPPAGPSPHAGDTTRSRLLASAPSNAMMRPRQPTAVVPVPLRAPRAEQTPRRRTVPEARAAAELSWAVAARLRRALGPHAQAWVSTTLRVVDSELCGRPDVAVGSDPLPVDGRAVPTLVVEVDRQRPVLPEADWLACGVQEVWILARTQVLVISGPAHAPTRRTVCTGRLTMPVVDAAVEVSALCSLPR